MTHDDMIAVIAADRDGKVLQARRRDGTSYSWEDCITGDPLRIFLNFQEWNYRIKPEPPKPREWHIGPMSPADIISSTVQRGVITGPLINTWIKVREVI